MNNIIDNNKKNMEGIRTVINNLHKDMIDKFNDLNNKNKTKIYEDGKYIGEIKNDLKEGKGIFYFNNDNRYEGDFKNIK